LSPLQFSLSISIVVILLGGAGLAGYYYGLKQAARTAAQALSEAVPGEVTGSDSQGGGPDAAVTFYSALTEPRQNPPVTKAPEPSKPALTETKEKPAAAPVPVPSTGKPVPGDRSFLLQVASYKNQVSAQKLLKELSSDGYAGTVVRADLGERGVWFRVRVGPYASQEEAGSVLERLRKERSLKGYVVK
jgi:cell division septation protein DedD